MNKSDVKLNMRVVLIGHSDDSHVLNTGMTGIVTEIGYIANRAKVEWDNWHLNRRTYWWVDIEIITPYTGEVKKDSKPVQPPEKSKPIGNITAQLFDCNIPTTKRQTRFP